MTDTAREMLDRLENLLAENSEALRSTLTNLSTFSTALARNSDRLDGIFSGLERLTGTGPNSTPVFYDLVAPKDFPAIENRAVRPFSVPEPTAVLLFDTQKILVRPSGAEGSSFSNARWTDNIPKLLQARIIQSFENAGLLRSVSRPADNAKSGFQLVVDIRSFQFSLDTAPQAEVEFSAKVVADDGRTIDARVFHETAPATSDNATAAAGAMNEAFAKAAMALVTWASAAF